MPGRAADAAGLRVGDVITRVGDEPVKEIRDIAQIVSRRRECDRVSIEFVRDGGTRQVDAVLKK